jgi:hypothetical protein
MSQSLRVPYAKHFRHSDARKLRRSRYMLKWFGGIETSTGATFPQAYRALTRIHDAGMLTAIALTAKEPKCTVAPAVTGLLTAGSVLTSTPGTWTGTPTPTLTYQWCRNATAIPGATALTYTIVAADSGKTLNCLVTGKNTLDSVVASSNIVMPT